MASTLIDRLFWAGHANPASVWAAIAAYPVLLVGLYRRDRRLVAGAAGTVALSSLLAPEPDGDDAWATRVVLGEQVWMERGLLSSPGDLLVLLVGAPIQLFTLRSALRRHPIRTAVGAALSLVVMFVFFGRMAGMYDDGQTIEQVVSTT